MNVIFFFIISFFLWIPDVLLFTWSCISQRVFFFSIKLPWSHLQFFSPLYTDSAFIMKQSNTIKHVALMMFKERLVVLSHTPPSEKAASWPDEAHSQIVPVTKMGVESIDILGEVCEMSPRWTFKLWIKQINWEVETKLEYEIKLQ